MTSKLARMKMPFNPLDENIDDLIRCNFDSFSYTIDFIDLQLSMSALPMMLTENGIDRPPNLS
jgi:hypothetical protein